MATYYTLTNSGLRYADVSYSAWNVNVDTFNWTRLNNTLLKYSALLDVDITGLTNNDILKYNSSSQKWERKALVPGWHEISTTTTTTTTSTTTTTT